MLIGTVQEGQGSVVPESIQVAFDYKNSRQAYLVDVFYAAGTAKIHIIWDYIKVQIFYFDDPT